MTRNQLQWTADQELGSNAAMDFMNDMVTPALHSRSIFILVVIIATYVSAPFLPYVGTVRYAIHQSTEDNGLLDSDVG